MSLKKALGIVLLVLLALVPWACGGGSNSSPTAPPNMGTPAPAPTPTATRY